MNGDLFNALSALHRKLHGCECLASGGQSCEECEAIFLAIKELTKVPRFLEMSDAIDASLFEMPKL